MDEKLIGEVAERKAMGKPRIRLNMQNIVSCHDPAVWIAWPDKSAGFATIGHWQPHWCNPLASSPNWDKDVLDVPIKSFLPQVR